MCLVSRPALPFLAVFALATVLTGCGAPPEPLPTAPPQPRGSAGEPSSSVGMPAPGGSFPFGGSTPGVGGNPLPGATLPTLPVAPTLPIPTVPRPTTPVTPTTTPPPPPAPVCTAGPSKQQLLDLVRGKPGVPTKPLEVRLGPYCASSWQFAELGIVGQNADSEEPLLVVSSGKPAALRLVEIGRASCRERV